jgi:lysophospholipase L1-like esterase
MEWPKERKGSEKRILTLGDSFTEGDGAPYDSSYVALMRGLLPEDSFYIMNGGICGSDPFNNFIILKDKLLPLKPDIIIQSVGSNDMTSDILIRGGLARFTKDGKQVWRPAPWWEPLYAGSYIFRVLAASVGYTEVLTKKTLNTDEQQRVNSETEDMFAKYSALCRSNHIQMIVILHPEKGELINNKYDYDFVPLVADLEKYGVKVIDLLPSYREYLERNHSDPKAYYWIYDGHHNSRGYKMMAESTLENIRPFLKDLNKNSR